MGGKTFTALASQTLSLKELAGYPLICLNEESMTRSFYRQFFLEHDAVLKPDTEAATTDQMLTLVKSELGLAFMPEPMAAPPAGQRRAGAAAFAGDHPLPFHLPCVRPSPPTEHRRPQVPAAADQGRGTERRERK